MSTGFPAGRAGDVSAVDNDAHGCSCCDRRLSGPALDGSSTVTIDGLPALRVGDCGVHSACCGANRWTAVRGSASVFINGQPAFRSSDLSEHCGGLGRLTAGSDSVFIGSADIAAGDPTFAPGELSLGLSDLEITYIFHGDILVSAITNFRHGLLAGLVSLGASLGEFFAIFGIGKLLGLLDKVVDGLGTALKYTFWSLARALPWVDKFFRTLRAFLAQLLNTIIDGARANSHIDDCPIFDGPLKKIAELDQYAFTEDGRKDWDALTTTKDDAPPPPHYDITLLVKPLLTAYRPVFVEDPEDYPPIALEELLQHATLKPLPPDVQTSPTDLATYAKSLAEIHEEPLDDKAIQYCLDIDDDYARGRFETTKRVYYARAINYGPNQIHLEYFSLRAGSCLPTRDLGVAEYEHAGDGEGCTVVLSRRTTTGPWELSGVLFEGKHYQGACYYQGDESAEEAVDSGDQFMQASDAPRPPVETADDGRPVVYVARGSHAMSGRPGPCIASDFGVGVDYYPERSSNTVQDYTLLTSADPDIHHAVFTRKVRWGNHSELYFIKDKGYNGKVHRDRPSISNNLLIKQDPG